MVILAQQVVFIPVSGARLQIPVRAVEAVVFVIAVRTLESAESAEDMWRLLILPGIHI